MSIPRWLENFEILKECIFIDADSRSPDQFYSPCYCKSIDGEDTCVGLTCLNYATQTECKIGKCSPKCKNNRFQMQNNVKVYYISIIQKLQYNIEFIKIINIQVGCSRIPWKRIWTGLFLII